MIKISDITKNISKYLIEKIIKNITIYKNKEKGKDKFVIQLYKEIKVKEKPESETSIIKNKKRYKLLKWIKEDKEQIYEIIQYQEQKKLKILKGNEEISEVLKDLSYIAEASGKDLKEEIQNYIK